MQKDVERLRKAREERERVKKFTERGIILNNQSSTQKLNTTNNIKNRPNGASLSRQPSEFSGQNSYRATQQYSQRSVISQKYTGSYTQTKSSVGAFNPTSTQTTNQTNYNSQQTQEINSYRQHTQTIQQEVV